MNLEEFMEHVYVKGRDGGITAFEPTPYQKAIIEYLDNGKNLNFYPNMRAKHIINDEFTCAHLMQMSQGQRFALVTPGKTFVFELTEIIE